MKKLVLFALGLIVILAIVLTSCSSGSSEPELVVENAYKHRGDYNGNYVNNTYTFVIKNDSRKTDIDSVDYFSIYFYDKYGDCVGSWDANRAELNKLSLNAGRSWEVQIDVPERELPYSEKWSYDTEYRLNYYD